MTGGLRIALATGALAVAGIAGFVIARSTVPSTSSSTAQAPAPAAADSAAPAIASAEPASRPEDAERESVCPDNPGSRSITYGAVRLETRRDEFDGCGFTLFGSDGAVLAQNNEGSVIVRAQYLDLDADAVPELLVVGESGGSLGLNDSILMTQASGVRVIELPGGAEPTIEDAPDGDGRVLTMLDQSFVFVELMCNACSPRPRMFYRLEDGALRLRNSRYAVYYDQHIRELEAQVTPQEFDEFLKAAPNDEAAVNSSTAAMVVLRVAVDYAASGRIADAMRVLEERWPAWDRDRVSELVRAHAIEP
jgi:hypothetical protein